MDQPKNKPLLHRTSLKAHFRCRGVYVTPFNRLPNLYPVHWFQDWAPEYLWMGLIIRHLGRNEGMANCWVCLKKIREINGGVVRPEWSWILGLPEEIQKVFLAMVVHLCGVDSLSPLTCLYTLSKAPLFAQVFQTDHPLKNRIATIEETLKEMSDHQSPLSTDIRYIIVFCRCSGRQYSFEEGSPTFVALANYPKTDHQDPIMPFYATTIRSMETAMRTDKPINRAFVQTFWDDLYGLEDCHIATMKFKKENEGATEFIAKIEQGLDYYRELLTSKGPLNAKDQVLFGLATFGFKRCKEVVEHDLYNTVSGRSDIRGLIEVYLTMVDLLKKEDKHPSIYEDFQLYGLGQFKVVVAAARESKEDLDSSHVFYPFLEGIVNEYRDEEFLNVDFRYFENERIRDKFNDCGKIDLYSLKYNYDSSYEHALWGAVRESSLLECTDAGHQYHQVPDIGDVENLKSVWPDCREMMSSIMDVLASC